MSISFRTKLLGIVSAVTVAFVLLIVTGGLISRQVDGHLARIRKQYLPQLELGPQVTAQFEHLRRAFQDAVATHDPDALAATQASEALLFRTIEGAGGALDARQASELHDAIEAYDRSATDVSRRLMGGETGERIVRDMKAMQAKQARVDAVMKQATAFNRDDLTRAFDAVSKAQHRARDLQLAVTLACLALLLTMATALGNGVIRAMNAITQGFERFGAGDLQAPIEVTSTDELGTLATRANEMAANLHRLADERALTDWLKAGLAGLTQELRGELEPEQVAGQSARFLAQYLGAPVAVLYASEDDARPLRPLGGYATELTGPTFERGEGLVGQAALGDDLLVLGEPPAGHLRIRSGLGESTPGALVLVPLRGSGRRVGVLELGFSASFAPRQGELLRAARESLAIALEVSFARAATRALLAETQLQAAQLTAQEEELRATNDELQSQQHELEQNNEELLQQTHELEQQRETLERANNELDVARLALERKANELVTVSAYKSQFLANMSHELRTPLNSMLLLSSLLADNEKANLDDKQVQYAKTIHGAGTDLLALINQVLDLAKVESGKQALQLAPMPLDALVTRARNVFEPLASEKGVRFVAELEPGLPESLFTDRHRVEQVLNNLLGNAIKFTAHGEVALRIARAAPDAVFARPELTPDQAVCLSVSDTGVGIAPEHQLRVFAPFEQVEAATDRRYNGTGLGLAIARELVTLLGGELNLESAPGQGSTFTVSLPLRAPGEARPHTAEHVARVAPAAPATVPTAPSLPPAAGHLLLIEDDPVFAETCADVIHAQGLTCQIARDGQVGLELARTSRPAGIILDVKLPGLDGWRVKDALESDPATAGIPVYFVSATDARERGMASGAVGYLVKPATRTDLLRVVDSLVPRPASRRCKVLIVEDDALAGDRLMAQLADAKLDARRVATAEAAHEALGAERYDCMVLDPARADLELLRGLRSGAGKLPAVVVYTARPLTRGEAQELEAYAEAVVIKEGASSERLLDELRLFARKLGAAPPSGAVPSLTAVRLDGRKILVVDDDMRTVFALSATLRAKGAEVWVADTGQAALDKLDAQPEMDAVLMDIMMPEMDGYEAMRQIRKDARFSALPIIALTAKAMRGEEQRSFDAGANAYLPKPLDPRRLLLALDERLSESQTDVD